MKRKLTILVFLLCALAPASAATPHKLRRARPAARHSHLVSHHKPVPKPIIRKPICDNTVIRLKTRTYVELRRVSHCF